MSKIGILTFHYSNNYGGVLQTYSLYKVIEKLGYDVEIINFVPSTYTPNRILYNLGLRKNIFKTRVEDINIIKIIKKIVIMNKYSNIITEKFDMFRNNELKLSEKVDEKKIIKILNNYELIIVGSDQVWNPNQRRNPEYFLNYGDCYKGKKISYAADSTISDINLKDINNLKIALSNFDFISVRNEHSYKFVKSIINKDVFIVADPTLLYDIKYSLNNNNILSTKDYILTYVLGEEIEGGHYKALEKIKSVYGNLPVYSIKIPTMNFKLSDYADKVFYDLDPFEWLNMLKNAKFIYTDSFHGVLYSLKFNKPFLAYYTEALRATRFIDIAHRYNLEDFIIKNVDEIDKKMSLIKKPNYTEINEIIKIHKAYSLEFLYKALQIIKVR